MPLQGFRKKIQDFLSIFLYIPTKRDELDFSKSMKLLEVTLKIIVIRIMWQRHATVVIFIRSTDKS